MMFAGVFSRRLRGFRIIDLVALSLVGVLALGSYVFTTFAGAQSARIAAVQAQINEENKRIHLLKAEIAHLEDPSRIERLSTQYLGLQPVDPKHDITPDALPQVASAPAPVAAPQNPKP
jgi:cell division protein FtsL